MVRDGASQAENGAHSAGAIRSRAGESECVGGEIERAAESVFALNVNSTALACDCRSSVDEQLAFWNRELLGISVICGRECPCRNENVGVGDPAAEYTLRGIEVVARQFDVCEFERVGI